MDLVEAIVLGIVQGLTEFLPISSTAHIRILPALVGWRDPGAAFTAVIQLGTLLAVLIYFRKDLVQTLTGWIRGLKGGKAARTLEARMGWAIFLGTLPIVVLGLAFNDKIEDNLRSLHVIAISLILMAALLWISETVGRRKKGLEAVTPIDGLKVGLWQAVALIPGASRSGSTITGSLFDGFDRVAAARFSFLLSVPSVLAAAVYELAKYRSEFAGPLLLPAIVANVFSFAVGYWSIGFLMKFLQSKRVLVFVGYRIVLGVAILALIYTGRIDPFAGLPVNDGTTTPSNATAGVLEGDV